MTYKYPKDSIKGYKTSKLAKTESQDCVVKTIANAFNMTYNQSHKLCKNELDRTFRKGVNTYKYYKFLSKGEFLGKKITEIKYETVEIKKKVVLRRTTWYEDGESYMTTTRINLYTKRGTKYSRMTVGAFCKKYKKGSFIISIRSHTFNVIDGVVCGNYQDLKQKRVLVERAWEVS